MVPGHHQPPFALWLAHACTAISPQDGSSTCNRDSGPLQVMGGISNMALWLQLPLTLLAPTSGQRASAASLTEGVPSPDPSQHLVTNGHHPPQASAKQATAGVHHVGRIVCCITMPACLVEGLASMCHRPSQAQRAMSLTSCEPRSACSSEPGDYKPSQAVHRQSDQSRLHL